MRNAAIYAALMPSIQEVAKKCGWIVAVYGSVQRDLDLLAHPFESWAISRREFLEQLCAIGFILNPIPCKGQHGRVAYMLLLDRANTAAYLDLSFIDLPN